MTDVNRIEVSADFQDITITVGEYGDVDARQAISVVDTGGDGSLAYNNATGVITYTGPSAADVRAHFSAGTGISLVNGVITNTSLNTDTTYTQDVTAATGGANLNLRGSDSSTDTVKFAAGAGITVAETDASTITVTSTITQYTDALARQAISVVDTGGFGSLAYNNGTGVITYTGPNSADIRTTVSAANTGTGYGELNYNQTTGTFTYTRVTDANIRGAISVVDAGGDGSLAYNNGTGVITYTGPSASEVRSHFTGGTGVSITNGDIALDFTEFSTSNITEGTNLYYTDARFDTRLATKTTTNLAEGTNLYYTDARARAAISVTDTGGYGSLSYDNGTGVITYTGPTGTDIRTEVQDGRNLTYTGSTLDLDKALSDVNSVSAEAGFDFTATGNRLVLRTRDVGGVAEQFLMLDSDGYNYAASAANPGVLTGSFSYVITNKGTTSEQFYDYLWRGDLTQDSNQIVNCEIFAITDGNLVTPLDWNTVVISNHPLFYGGSTANNNTIGPFQLGVRIQSVSIDSGTPTLATVTLETSDGATAATPSGVTGTVTDRRGRISHYFRNSAKNIVVFASNFNSNTAVADTTGVWPRSSYIASGLVSNSNRIAVDYWSHSYTVAPTAIIGGRKLLKLEPANSVNEHINVPYGLGVGPGAISTNRGVPGDPADAIGINLYNPGTLNGYNGKTIFNLTQFSDNSYFISGQSAERAGGQFAFNHVRGNATTATLSTIYARTNDNLGRVTWWSQSGSAATSLVSSDFTPATIVAVATEDHTGSTTTSAGQPAIGSNTGQHAVASGKHGVGVALQYTPNSAGVSRPRTFLMANDKTVELRSVDSVILKPVSKVSQGTDRGLFTSVNHTWLTAGDYVAGSAASGTNSLGNGSGAKVTVGITSASGNNGDVGLVLQRATGNTANFELKLPSGSSNTLELINNATSTTIATVTDSAITLNTNTKILGGRRTFGCFHKVANVTAAAADTVYAFDWTTDTTPHVNTNGVTVSNTSRINIDTAGSYNVVIELVGKNVDNADRVAYVWLAKNGNDLAETAIKLVLTKDTTTMLAKDWLVENIAAGDYLEVRFAVDTTTSGISLEYTASQSTPYARPAVPSATITITPVGA